MRLNLVKFYAFLDGLIRSNHPSKSYRVPPAKDLVVIAQSTRMAVSNIDLQKLPLVTSFKSGYSWGVRLPIPIVAPA